MKKLFYPHLSRPDMKDDCMKLASQLRAVGYEANLKDICSAWEHYSGSVCAGWISLSSYADDNVARILPYLVEQDWED